MAIKAKPNKQANNILYLQDADAKALGIIEGSSQRVFIDNREVEVVFVDEHEVIPVSNEDKKLYQDAYKIAAKYAEESYPNESATQRSISKHNESNKTKQPKEAGESKWSSFWSKFKREPKENRWSETRKDQPTSSAMVKYDSSKIDDSYSSRNDRYANDNHRRHAKHSIRNDVFTKEELEIIQNVIDKSRNPEPVVSKKTNSSKSKVKSKNKRK